jgi:type II secretory ATPase GspE/PulE/Tfp pilus assembly ATPase PilB-like protein
VRITDGVKRLLVQSAGAEELRAEVQRAGVVTLRRAGLEKIDQGQSSIAEIMRSIYVL